MSPVSIRPIAFTGGLLDRSDQLRNDPEALGALLGPRARVLRLEGLEPVLDAEGGLAWGSLAEVDPAAELVFLGLDGEGRGHFVAAPASVPASPHASPRSWAAMAPLSPDQLASYGTARALASWHARHRHCAQCGGATRLAKGGWQRNCEGCGAEHFPRTDPVTIMTVEHGDALLMGRQPRFPPRRYSALAGFVEPGESLEEAVAREVFEEAGVRVDDVRYVASQPWPFPSSLMIGCHAVARSRELVIDHTELEDARWFSRAEIAEAFAAPGGEGPSLIVPPPFAIARHLVERWMGMV